MKKNVTKKQREKYIIQCKEYALAWHDYVYILEQNPEINLASSNPPTKPPKLPA